MAGSQRSVRDVLRAAGAPPQLLLLPEGRDSLAGYHATHWASREVLTTLCSVHRLEEGRGAAAEVALPAEPTVATAAGWRRLLVLDGVSDPGNVGALLRTALGLGWDGAVLMQGCAAISNPKVFRAAGGVGLWMLPIISRAQHDTLEQLLAEGGHSLLVADSHSEDLEKWMVGARKEAQHLSLARSVGIGSPSAGPASKIALVLGSEANGVSDAVGAFPKARCVGLPMQNGVDSLGVAQAGAIMLDRLSLVNMDP